MFESFAPMFQQGRYLTLLHPYRPSGVPDPEVVEALAVADACTRACGSRADEICALLSATNWRPNLVGAAVVLRLGSADPAMLAALWQSIDRPSWVSPQLAVCASVVDPSFADEARARVATAPAKTANALAALLGLEDRVPDVDDGARIALNWRAALK